MLLSSISNRESLSEAVRQLHSVGEASEAIADKKTALPSFPELNATTADRRLDEGADRHTDRQT